MLLNYFLYLRPASFPVTFLLAFTGYAIGPEKASGVVPVLLDLFILFLVYSVLLWGGTNAFNSGQDRDQGKINLLSKPPSLPPGLSAWGLSLKVLAIAVGFFVSFWTGCLCFVATILSLYYSWKFIPGKRGKEIPGVDLLINAGGCGVGSILIGYSFASPSILHPDPLIVGLGFSMALLGGMPTSQIFQLNEGERNYTSILGTRRVLRLGTFLFLVHICFLATLFPPGEATVAVLLPWAIWIILVVAAGLHSWNWSKSPKREPYRRMLMQMNLLMISQLSWSLFAWISGQQ